MLQKLVVRFAFSLSFMLGLAACSGSEDSGPRDDGGGGGGGDAAGPDRDGASEDAGGNEDAGGSIGGNEDAGGEDGGSRDPCELTSCGIGQRCEVVLHQCAPPNTATRSNLQAGAAWPTRMTWLGSPLPQKGVPMTWKVLASPTMASERQNCEEMPR